MAHGSVGASVSRAKPHTRLLTIPSSYSHEDSLAASGCTQPGVLPDLSKVSRNYSTTSLWSGLVADSAAY